MSNTFNRIDSIVNKLKYQFENSPYFLGSKFEESRPENKDDILLSIIIPTRNEFPNIVHTCYSLWHCLEAEGFDPNSFEIIIVNNCSTDWQDPKWSWEKPGDRGTTDYLLARGAYWSRKIRLLYDPIAGNHSARNKGAAIARGKYIFFSDAHMAYRPGFFSTMIDTINSTGGMFHGTIAWMGAYPPHAAGVGCGYTLKLGEEIKGTWNNYRLSEDKFFFIPALGHCSVGVLRQQFLDFGGYPDIHRSYGGGEFYINLKWWMFGSNVSTHPHAIGYHLASGRGYVWYHDDYVHNVINIGYALGMDDWLERSYINWIRKGKKSVMDKMLEEAKKEMAKDREYIKSRRVMSFNEVLMKRPWEQLNKELFGRGLPNVMIFHPTWVNLLKDAPQFVRDIYNNSPIQKELDKFIREELWDYVYLKDKFDRNTPFTLV